MKNAVIIGFVVALGLALVGCSSGPQRTGVYHKDGNGNIVSGQETIVEKVNGEKITTTNVLGADGQVLGSTQVVEPDPTKGELFGIYKGPSQYSSRAVYGRYGRGYDNNRHHSGNCNCSACRGKKHK